MAVIKTIPKDSRFVQTITAFTANFNVPALGLYSFNVAANTNVPVLSMTRQSIYLLERYSFSATTGEDIFLKNVSTIPLVQLRLEKNPHPVYKLPLPCANYIDSAEAIAYFESPQDTDRLLITFSGILAQSAELVGVPSIKAQISLNIYEIVDTQWINRFRNETGGQRGLII